jgi:hypothetical protein
MISSQGSRAVEGVDLLCFGVTKDQHPKHPLARGLSPHPSRHPALPAEGCGVSNPYVIGIDPAGVTGGGFAAHFKGRFLPQEQRFTDREPQFVRAFVRAAERTPDLDPARVVTDPLRDDWVYVNEWLFGPIGEFTSFAKLNILSEELGPRQLDNQAGEEFRWRPRNRYIRGVTFKVTLLSPRRFLPSRRGHVRDNTHDEGILSFMRFATYDDYVMWAAFAQSDRTEIER